MKLINLHKKWMEAGEIKNPRTKQGGLCNVIPKKYKKYFALISPTSDDMWQLVLDGKSRTFWASLLPLGTPVFELSHTYTPMRQNIVLLICAMHNEL